MSLFDLDWPILTIIVVAFIGGGVLKGVAGAGLPMILVSTLASFVSPAMAIAVSSVPLFSSNVVQVWQGRNQWPQIARFWPMLLPIFLFTILGAQILIAVDPKAIALVLGIIVSGFTAIRFFVRHWRVSPSSVRFLGPVIGSVSGILGGVSSFHGPPLMMYFAALGLKKDLFVPLLCTCFVAGGLPLYASLVWHGELTWHVLLLSALAAVPVQVGLEIGRRLRGRISEAAFANFVTLILVGIGLNLIRRGLS